MKDVGFKEISLYLDGELGGAERVQVEKVIAADEALSAMRESYARDIAAVETSLKGLDLGAQISERVMARLPKMSVRAEQVSREEAIYEQTNKLKTFVSLAVSLAIFAVAAHLFPFGMSMAHSRFSLSLANVFELCISGVFFLGLLCLLFARYIVIIESYTLSLISRKQGHETGFDLLLVRVLGFMMMVASLMYFYL